MQEAGKAMTGAVVSLSFALAIVPAMWAAPPQEQAGLPLIFSDDFEDGAGDWEMTDSKAWGVIEEEGNHVLALQRPSDYSPPVRSPHNIARVRGLKVGDFVYDVRFKQTGREYGHRDLCLFFGYQDASHFYYCHLATTADAHANSIFLVNGAPRVSIAKERTDGTDWGQGYHNARITRCTESGRIEVFFDDMEKPVMVAEDKTFLSGGVGVGSFDDTGHFDAIRVWGKSPGPGSSDGAGAAAGGGETGR